MPGADNTKVSASKASSSTATLLGLLACSLGIYGSFFYWSLLQERIMTQTYVVDGAARRFTYGFVANFLQYTVCVLLSLALFAAGYLVFGAGGTEYPLFVWRRMPLAQVASLGLTLSLGTPFGYAAMRRMPFPLVLAAKMCKIIPIVVVGRLFHGHHYSRGKYAAAAAITVGVLLFSLLDPKNKKKMSAGGEGGSGGSHGSGSLDSSLLETFVGLCLCGINLVLDGYTNSTQDTVFKRTGAGFLQMMAVSNFAAVVFCGMWLVVGEGLPLVVGAIGGPAAELFAAAAAGPGNSATTTGASFPWLMAAGVADVFKAELFAAVDFMRNCPDVVHDLLLMVSLGAVGQIFIFATIANFGSVTTTAVTLTRKVGSVLASILLGTHTMALDQWSCMALIIAGVGLDTYVGITEKKQGHHHGGHHHHHQHHAVTASASEARVGRDRSQAKLAGAVPEGSSRPSRAKKE